MHLILHAVGRMKSGPEHELFERYFSRAGKLAPQLGFQPPRLREIVESRADEADIRKQAETDSLRETMRNHKARLVIFDERARSLSSPQFARHLCTWRDGGTPAVVFGIGGPDGHDPSIIPEAALAISFGSLTMPHQIVRILVAEQIYRAMTITANHPYHRV